MLQSDFGALTRLQTVQPNYELIGLF